MSSNIMLAKKWKLTTALCTSMLASSMCLFSTAGDSASLESVRQKDINQLVQNEFDSILGNIGNIGGNKPPKPPKVTDPADAFATKSPIKHVIILIGENRGLDHTFGVYKPKGKGQTISNLL